MKRIILLFLMFLTINACSENEVLSSNSNQDVLSQNEVSSLNNVKSGYNEIFKKELLKIASDYYKCIGDPRFKVGYVDKGYLNIDSQSSWFAFKLGIQKTKGFTVDFSKVWALYTDQRYFKLPIFTSIRHRVLTDHEYSVLIQWAEKEGLPCYKKYIEAHRKLWNSKT